MWLAAFCYVTVWFTEPVTVEGLELYQRINHHQVAVLPDGTALVLDQDESTVHVVSPDGAVVRRFGIKGEGPGELNYPTEIRYADGVVGINDQHGINLFKPDGTFLLRGGSSWSARGPVAGGVFAGDLPFGQDFSETPPPGSAAFYQVSDDLVEGPRLGSWARPGPGHREWGIFSNGQFTLYYTAAPDAFQLEISPDGRTVYYYPAGIREVLVFDAVARKQLASLPLPGPLPLNEVWADAQADDVREKGKKNGRLKELIVTKPDYFPACRRMNLLDGVLHVMQWSQAPDKAWPVVAFDREGRPTKPLVEGLAVAQVVGLWQDNAWVITWDAEAEQSNLVRCSRDQIAEVVAAGPMSLYRR